MQPSLLQSLIPAAKLSAVEKALLQTFNTLDLSDIKPLTGGLSTSAVFKIIVDNQPYVLKLGNTEGPGNNTALACMEIAANAGIAPLLYYLNTKDALSITQFIENKPLRAFFTSPDILLAELATTIKSIHAMPPFPKEDSLLNTVETLIGQVKELPLFTTSFFRDVFEYFDIIRRHYPWHDADKVSSHNDLNPNNLIGDGKRLWIVDWDAAFLNDRYVDLAISANFFVANEVQENLFLETYFGDALNSYNKARFFIMRQICHLIYAILMFKLASASDSTGIGDDPAMQTANLKEIAAQIGAGKLSLSTCKGQLQYGKAMLNEALHNMRLPRFASSIELLAETQNLK